MMRGLLSGAGCGGRSDTSRRATPITRAARRIFATEGEPLWA